jgi:uncharacterized membrane protein YbhN (UPF0104 family)
VTTRVERRRIELGGGLAAIALVAAAVLAGTQLVDPDRPGHLFASLPAVAAGIRSVRWQFPLLVVALAGLHYLLAAIALRAVSGTRLPLPELTMTQLAAATANRLTPAGLGGAAVNVRYLGRRGVPAGRAVGALAALTVLGAIADAVVFGLLILGGSWFGVTGGDGELAALGGRATQLLSAVSRLPHPVLLVAGTAGAVTLLVAADRLRRRSMWGEHWATVRTAMVRLPASVAQLGVLRRPRALAILFGASAGTTLVLGVAFVLSVVAVPGGTPDTGPGRIFSAYLLGAVAANALPTPAGIGSTDAALVAALVAARIPVGHAVQTVVLFRLLTFWTPAAAGVFTARALRRRGAL